MRKWDADYIDLTDVDRSERDTETPWLDLIRDIIKSFND